MNGVWFDKEEEETRIVIARQANLVFYKSNGQMVFSIPVIMQVNLQLYNTHTIREFLVNKEFELVNQEKEFSKVFEENGLMNENTKVFVHRITCNGSKVTDRKVNLYPFITVDGSNKAFYVYEGAAIITFPFKIISLLKKI